ncbi:MAG: ribonuclease P protein component [Chitinophagaceae bacterium]|nr:ribonuclease P protein component [Chitinophagaceae bacterium]
MKTSFTLGKKERLKSRKLIEQLFKEGKTFTVFPFRVYYLTRPLSDVFLQAGFTVSARKFKKAVDRNRIKRQMREAYRLQKHLLELNLKNKQRCLSLFFLYTGSELPDSSLAQEKMALTLKKIIKIMDEPTLPAA